MPVVVSCRPSLLVPYRYSPYIVREQSTSGDALLNWKAWATDISNKAGVSIDNRGYLAAEVTLQGSRSPRI